MSCIAKVADFFFFETERIFAGTCQLDCGWIWLSEKRD